MKEKNFPQSKKNIELVNLSAMLHVWGRLLYNQNIPSMMGIAEKLSVIT